MGAPLGNNNAGKAKRWQAAIERALERRASGEPRPTDVSNLIAGLDLAADQFVSAMFTDNDLGYFKEFGDRIDGKPKQTVAGDEDAPLSMTISWKNPSTS